MIANETCAARGVVDEVRYRAGAGGEVLVVAPALARSRLEHWLDVRLERRQAEALARLDASVSAFTAAGLTARGHLGDADPLQALDDALRIFDPDEVIISTHPPPRSNWLERQVVRRARERYDMPITHVVVDLELESADDLARHPSCPLRPERRPLRVFHASDYDEALAIREAGFRDGPPRTTRAPGCGSRDRPPAGDRTTRGSSSPSTSPRTSSRATRGGPAGGRRFLMPAELLNRHGPPVVEGDWSE